MEIFDFGSKNETLNELRRLSGKNIERVPRDETEARKFFCEVYLKALDECLHNELLLDRDKNLIYYSVISYYLKEGKYERAAELYQDLNRISKPHDEIEKILLKSLHYKLFRVNTLEEFKSCLKSFLIFALTAEKKFETTFVLIQNFFKTFIFRVLKESKSAESILKILNELTELQDTNLLDISVRDSIFLGIRYFILSVKKAEINEKVQTDLFAIKNSLLILFPAAYSHSIMFEFTKILSVNVVQIPQICKEFSLNTLVPGPVLEVHSQKNVRLIIRKFFTKPGFKFRQIIAKIYEFPNEQYFKSKVYKEIFALKALERRNGFAKILAEPENKDISSPFYMFLSASDRISKSELTPDHLHQIIDYYLFLYTKKQTAKLPDSDFFYVDTEKRILLSDFTFFNFSSTPSFTSTLDLHGNFNDLPLVDDWFMQELSKLVQSYSSNFDSSIKKDFTDRLSAFNQH